MKLHKSLTVALGLAMLLGISACSDDEGGKGGDSKADGGLKLALVLRNQGGTTFFQDVAAGAKAKADELGADLTVQFTDSTDEQLAAIDTLIAQGIDGLIVTAQDSSIGPTIATKAKSANILLLASSDVFKDADGDDVPVVTIDAPQGGTDVGELAASTVQDAGWTADGATKALSVDLPSLETCNERTDNAKAAFNGKTDLADSDIVDVEYDGTLEDALDTVSTALNNYRDVTRWVVWSCNDEGVVGALQAMANAGLAPADLIGIGLGANLACDQFEKDTGYRAAIKFDAREHGAIDVETMVTALEGKTDLPPVTMFPGVPVDPETPAHELPC
jgi:L-arabinose transport system substrate-binding protein